MPQSHTAGRNATGRKAESGSQHDPAKYERVGNNGKTLTVTEHMMARLIVHAWQMMALARQLYPYSVISMKIE